MRLPILISLILFNCLLSGCQTNLYQLPTFSANKQLQAVVVTPAGSNRVQEYDAQQKAFKPALRAGVAQSINFLPLPGNLGFIPSTRIGSGNELSKALAVLVLSESAPAGTVQEVIPIATILLDVAGELSYMVIAVPARPSERFINAIDLISFTQDFPAGRQIVHTWFLNYLPNKQVRIAGWKDEKYTEILIRKQML